mmetsp:Transcript_19989/g.53423  ORF Transcript_19989/g.53423 Transcript_19989/m.53423 type:complete len:268 (+) Transcript_19989:1034-1837(+)
MVLHDISDDAEAIKVPTSTARAQILLEDNLNVRNVAVVPQWLEELVPKAHGNKIQHDLLTQVVVDAKKLVFREERRGGGIQFCEGLAVATERFLQDQPRGSSNCAGLFLHAPGDVGKDGGRNGQEKYPVARASALQPLEVLVQACKALGLVVGTSEEGTSLQELGLVLSPDVHALLLQESLQVHSGTAVPHDIRCLGQQRSIGAAEHELVECGIEFLPCQISRCSEENDRHWSHHVNGAWRHVGDLQCLGRPRHVVVVRRVGCRRLA